MGLIAVEEVLWDKGGGDDTYLSMEYLAQYYIGTHKNDKVKEYIQANDLYVRDADGEYILDRFKKQNRKG